MVQEEAVEHNGEILLHRPDDEDATDSERLTATALEQINVNRRFRPIAEFFDEVTYLHLVPQMVRHGAEIGGNRLENDPFGQGFLERIAATNGKTRQGRLTKIATALAHIVPQLEEITFERDKTTGQPHLKARFDNWRANDVWQREDQFSDGTLRYLSLLAVLLDPDPPPWIGIEEPELGLHPDIVFELANLLVKASQRTQLVVTTHSHTLVDALTDHPTSVVACGKHEGQTWFKRVTPGVAEAWLNDNSLGQVWSMGGIGGNRW